MIRVQGLDFHVCDVRGNRPALVFLHYWGGTGRTWDLVIRRELASRISGTEFIVLPGVGHLSPLEALSELAAAITTAISKIR